MGRERQCGRKKKKKKTEERARGTGRGRKGKEGEDEKINKDLHRFVHIINNLEGK